MKFESATIKDIAKALGLSKSTVSRALCDHYGTSAATKQLVREYADKINYQPNPIAKSLKEKKTRSIGVIISEIANSFFSQNINGIESVANEKGYTVIISQTAESFEREAMACKFLSSRSVDGILISVATGTKDFSPVTELHNRGMPIVCFDRVIDQINTHKVIVDNVRGAYEGALHLINNEYRNIAFIGSDEGLAITRDRLKGYMKALEEKRIPFEDAFFKKFRPADRSYERMEYAMDELMKGRKKPDAVFLASDSMTTNFLRYCRKKSIRVPEDIAIVGFSNLDVSDLLCPSLTVVRQPAFEMGRLAAELLIKTIESRRPVTQFETSVLNTELIVRDSSSPKPRAVYS